MSVGDQGDHVVATLPLKGVCLPPFLLVRLLFVYSCPFPRYVSFPRSFQINNYSRIQLAPHAQRRAVPMTVSEWVPVLGVNDEVAKSGSITGVVLRSGRVSDNMAVILKKWSGTSEV